MIRYTVFYKTAFEWIGIPVKSLHVANHIALVLIAAGESNIAVERAA